jgi:transcription-repair coupling factor (superfamily II helicase)
MMNSLSFHEHQNSIEHSRAVTEVLKAYRGNKFPLEIDGAEASFSAFLLASLYKSDKRAFLLVVPTEREASELILDLESLGISVLQLPWWGSIPYREMAPLSLVFGERTKALAEILTGKAPVIVIPERAFLTPLAPPEYFSSLLFKLEEGGVIDTAVLAQTLTAYGYTRVPRVQFQGEFALRGEVLDLLMAGDDKAYRILFDFDTIESIKLFDPVDQSGLNRVKECFVRPLKEVVWSDDRIDVLSKNLSQFEEFQSDGLSVIDELMTSGTCSGEELYFPLAFEKSANILDYLDNETSVFFLDRERLENAMDVLEREYESLYKKARREKEVPAPERLLLPFKETASKIKRRISFMSIKGGGESGAEKIQISCDPPRSFFGNINYLREEIANLIKQGWKFLVAAETEAQAGRLAELLREEQIPAIAMPLSAGFALPDIKFMLIQENEIFGRRKRLPQSLKHTRSAAIDTFVELNPGDFIVHVNYGIGLFKGIDRIRALGHERDYIKVEYADEETVFVPIEQVNLVQRYIGNEGTPPKLDKLGSKSWENRKGKVKKAVEDIAQKLVDLYSKRKAAQGFAFSKDTEWQTVFEAAFPYEETEDQLRCVEEIKADMESSHPMDRLVCGDVGYGKTEVAVRACFKAVMGGKQVAFLAPTTILAEQHFENFKERFSQFPVRLGMLSRFVDKKDIKKTIEEVKKGEVDILVGTHRLIQKDVAFKDLGLMVIDEEQRFGVKDKEKLKVMKNNVDSLSLSATPIPRTLHMSLLKIRDMSILSTAPQNRHPIETVIGEYNEDRLAAAIRQEVERGGQVFFLHNRIESLNEVRQNIERLVPEMLVETAHGQMDPKDLEDVMHRFIHGGFHVLVSTTIIENGIDIPNVNTIIIDRADRYGVSQLYQLRGRVGRSDRAAYAYLFYPSDKALSEIAMKRLQVISDFTDLGSGFKIAMKDMEIRGAGNLLGKEQSGEIYAVGFDMYLRLLDEAIRKLEDSSFDGDIETLLELEYTGFIPDSYIDSAQAKMEVYKKIASIQTKDELERVYAELIDRFGPLPDEAQSLLSLAEIRIICREIAVASLKERSGLVRVEFKKVSKVKIDRLIRLMQESGGKVKLDPKMPNILILQTGNIGLKEKSEFIREKLAALVM